MSDIRMSGVYYLECTEEEPPRPVGHSSVPQACSPNPHAIMIEKVQELVRALGIETQLGDITRIEITPGRIEVVRHRRNERGRPYLAGQDIATETVSIKVM